MMMKPAITTRKIFFLAFLVSGFAFSSQAQSLTFYIKDSLTKEPLYGATVMIKGTDIGGVADEYGAVIIQNIPKGYLHYIARMVGYEEQELQFEFKNQFYYVEFLLVRSEEELDEI